MQRTYTVAEVSEITGLPRKTIYRAMDDGRLDYLTPNGCTRRGRRLTEQQVDRWLEEGKARR